MTIEWHIYCRRRLRTDVGLFFTNFDTSAISFDGLSNLLASLEQLVVVNNWRNTTAKTFSNISCLYPTLWNLWAWWQAKNAIQQNSANGTDELARSDEVLRKVSRQLAAIIQGIRNAFEGSKLFL